MESCDIILQNTPQVILLCKLQVVSSLYRGGLANSLIRSKFLYTVLQWHVCPLRPLGVLHQPLKADT